MRASMKFLIPTLAAAALLSACGSSSSSSSSSAASTQPASSSGTSVALVKTASNSTVGGKILINARGMTLYHLSGEKAGKFICTSKGCLQAWHPILAPAGGKPTGSVASLGVVKRPDGTEQVTYKGEPLYTFAQDSAPGQVHGQGIKDVGTWHAVTAGASASAPAASGSTTAASSSSSSSGGGGGYGY